MNGILVPKNTIKPKIKSIQELVMALPYDELVKTDVDLKAYNALNISARADYFAAITSVDQLKAILHHPETDQDSLLILGGGSNVLFSGDCAGLVLHIEITGKEVIKETEENVWLKIGAGENWHQTVRYCVDRGWGGIENLSLIPGTTGAAPIQNIGAYGVEVADVFQRLEALNIEKSEVECFEKRDCQFGYRDSIFKNERKGKYIVTEVVLKLSKAPSIKASYGAIQSEIEKRDIMDPDIKDISDIVIDIRNSKLPDPKVLGNAGSFFKNPVVESVMFDQVFEQYPDAPGYTVNDDRIKIPAAWLIEKAGWKGKKVGNTGTYKQHALVIVNYGGASGKEILELVQSIQESVKKKFGILLTPEVHILC